MVPWDQLTPEQQQAEIAKMQAAGVRPPGGDYAAYYMHQVATQGGDPLTYVDEYMGSDLSSGTAGDSRSSGVGPPPQPDYAVTDAGQYAGAGAAGPPPGGIPVGGMPGVGSAAPPPMAPPPAAGVSSAPVPGGANYGGGADYGGGQSYTGGGSGGSYQATGVDPAMPGGRSQWSQILHDSGALQNPGAGIPFDQYPGGGDMFRPYMEARGWSSPANSVGSDPGSSVGGGLPNRGLMDEPVQAPPVGVNPQLPMAQPGTPQFGGPPQVPGANPMQPETPSLGMNMQSPGAPPTQGGGMPPMAPPPMGQQLTPEEMALRASQMNNQMRGKYGGY